MSVECVFVTAGFRDRPAKNLWLRGVNFRGMLMVVLLLVVRNAVANEPPAGTVPVVSGNTTLVSVPAQPADLHSIRRATAVRPVDHGVGRFVSDLEFQDLQGKRYKLSEFCNAPFTVVAMTSTSCPLSRKYIPTLTELVRTYSKRNVRFLVVNCVATDSADAMKRASGELGGNAAYVHDAEEVLSRQLGALTTTDVLVLDTSRTVVYHGAIDDQYGLGYALDAPRNRYLSDALESLLGGRVPEVSATIAPGCVLDSAITPVPTEITWHNRISRIMNQNCAECHRAGGVGPFALDTYQDAVAHAAMIRLVLDAGTMPPWFAAPLPGKGHTVWANDRSLTADDRRDLLEWLSSSRPEGNPADAPLPRKYPSEWTIGEPDYVVQIPKPIAVKATGTMPYQFVTAATSLNEDRWIQGYEIIPTDPGVVHHVIVNVHEKGAGPITDREEGVGGYWAAYVPGNVGQVYPTGFAKRLPAGAVMSFQIHYTPNGRATTDQLKIGLRFADSEPRFVVTTIPIANTRLRIPAHEADHVETMTVPVPNDVDVLAYLAHMHVRGKAFKFELLNAAGESETLLDIPRYDFNWQLRYDYREPRRLPAGSQVRVTAVYDNSENNPANPDPTVPVRWGPQTHEEMMIGYIETYLPVGAQRETIRSAVTTADRWFSRIDMNGDGRLTREEVQRAAERAPRLRDQPALLNRLFDRRDTDKDGQLSSEEFREFFSDLGIGR